MKYVGVDLHKRRFSVCWRGEDDSEELESYPIDAQYEYDFEIAQVLKHEKIGQYTIFIN